jgi:3-hydroxyisobutyrate dehydrogenase
MTVGFIGLGRMGRGMALNLLKAQGELVVFSTNPGTVQALVEEGATAAASVAELAGQSDVVFTSLPGPAQVEDVVLGQEGIVKSMRPGLTLIELSTSSLSLAQRIASSLERAGGYMLDAPVSGGPSGAASGELALWVGGDPEVFSRHLDLLRVIGKWPRLVGPVGSGTVTKLANNMVGYMIMQSLAEVFSMAVKAGVEPLELWKALKLGVVGKESALNLLVKQFLPGVYEPPAFALTLAHKDVTLATQLARDIGVPMRMANLTMAEMTEALGRGFGTQDSRSFLKLQLDRAGVEIAVEPALIEEALAESDPAVERTHRG